MTPWLPNRFAKAPGEKTEICIDWAVGYSLRLIPSDKVLARFDSTLKARATKRERPACETRP